MMKINSAYVLTYLNQGDGLSGEADLLGSLLAALHRDSTKILRPSNSSEK